MEERVGTIVGVRMLKGHVRIVASLVAMVELGRGERMRLDVDGLSS